MASLPAAGSGDAGDTGRALSQFGIGYVLLADPADQPLAGQLNTAAGLQPLTRSSSYDLWQVSGTVARARVVTPSGAAVAVPSGPVGVNTRLAPGTAGTLVLAEATGGWSATLDGKPLTPDLTGPMTSRLTRITRQLKERNLDRALRDPDVREKIMALGLQVDLEARLRAGSEHGFHMGLLYSTVILPTI